MPKQIKLPEQELDRLKNRIWRDFLASKSNYQSRIEKTRRWWRMWRGLPETMGSVDGEDFQVPMVKWITFGQWARLMQAITGDDAEIVAKPTAPLDEKICAKVGHYMTWRFFEYMKSLGPLATWVFRSILQGRAIAEVLYEQDFYYERDEKTGVDSEKLSYDGPRLRPLWGAEFITPAQDNVANVDEFEWVIRRRRFTPQDLLDGEARGKFQGVKANWDQIYAFAQQRQERDYAWDDEKIDSDRAEGVDHSTVMGNRDSVEAWEWYGTWRMLKGNRQVKEESLFYRDTKPSELKVTFLPKMMLVVGVEDLRDIYPRMKKRRPFVDLALVKDGSYWSPGLGELLEDIQREGTVNHALFRKAGMLSVGPVVFYKPGGGLDPDTFEYEPGQAIPTEDPSSVKILEMKADLQYPIAMQQLLKGISEILTGVSDTSAGLSEDRPNAPRTASGQAMLIQEGSVRASLDMTMLREDLSQMLEYVWALDREYSDESVFFRVTEEDAGGLYDVDKGFGIMTAEERNHAFDFQLKFATSVYSREAKKQALLALYQLSMQNPIVGQNPRALWVLLNRIWKAFGEDDFKAVVPEPPEVDTPKQPKEEWALALKGEDIEVNPMDDDLQHLVDHRRRLEDEMQEEEDRRDQQAERIMVAHIMQHEQARRQKALLQTLMQEHLQQMQQQQQQPGAVGPGGMAAPGQIPQPVPEAPVPVFQPQPGGQQ